MPWVSQELHQMGQCWQRRNQGGIPISKSTIDIAILGCFFRAFWFCFGWAAFLLAVVSNGLLRHCVFQHIAGKYQNLLLFMAESTSGDAASNNVALAVSTV